MAKLSKHISVKEMQCKCPCHVCNVHQSILDVAESLRSAMNVKSYHSALIGGTDYGEIKLYISSGCRCPEHNKAVGGSKNSQHLCYKSAITSGEPGWREDEYCRAIDGWFYYGDSIENRLDAEDVLRRYYKDGIIRGLGLYDKHRFHIDTRESGRWFKDYRK